MTNIRTNTRVYECTVYLGKGISALGRDWSFCFTVTIGILEIDIRERSIQEQDKGIFYLFWGRRLFAGTDM